MAMAVDYATKTIRQLPNFFATRDTISFEDAPAGQRPDSSYIPYMPLHAVGRLTETVLYRDGKEIVESEAGKQKRQEPAARGLTTSGVFGPILGTVLVDAAQSELAWSHWEQGANGLRAVFRFVIPQEKSHYQVQFCCVSGEGGDGVFRKFPAYHGEIAVDPVSGAILRLTLKADLKPSDPLVRSDIMVEYGPVVIGGQAYTCPMKSVSVTRAPMPTPQLQRYRGELLDKDRWAAREHLQTLLNDVVFENYHVFRSEARVLPGDNTGDAGETAPAEPESAEPATTPPEGEKQGPPPADNHASAAPPESGVPVATAAPAATVVAPPAPAPEPAVPEISEAAGAGLPDVPPVPGSGAQEKGFTLRVTTQLVDVSVVALDKKGHPVRDLQPEDFEVYDNGRRQAVRFFSRAEVASAAEPVEASGQPGSPPEQLVYSNRRADLADAKPGTAATESSVTILLIDASSLAWADFSYAREQMINFLQKLPAGERVGLYEQSARGFRILVEGTTDHASIASKLRQWMPNAKDLARAQEIEQRNRQQFDEVLHQEDLQYVNGNMNTPAVTTTMVDPQLRDFGSNPGRDALSILVRVARHLAAVPGHKNLVWVASDNVLANWEDKAVGTDKGGKQTRDFVLHAQEALNDAQVSVYPLDASQLNTQAVDASLQNSNVQLSPSVTVMPNQGPGSSAEQPAQMGGPALGAFPPRCNRIFTPFRALYRRWRKPPAAASFAAPAALPPTSTPWSQMAVPPICWAFLPTRRQTTSTTS